MAGFTDLFSIEELKALDEKELKILYDAIRREIYCSPEIRRILREKARQVYQQLTEGSSAKGSPSS
jgi:hypothetical protein